MFRNLISLIEHETAHAHVWHSTSADQAGDVMHPRRTSGDLGHGFYVFESPALTKDPDEEDQVILEYQVHETVRILDLQNEQDRHIWHRYENVQHNPKLWKLLTEHGIDGVSRDGSEGICIFNLDALRFSRVYSGVIHDPLSETDTHELDEVALGGLRRCTAVTVNALLSDFNLRPIILSEVPIDNPGVLNILNTKGLSYRPFPGDAGRTVLQFANTHKLFDWYLLSPGHAMALIRGELFDAENKGADSRQLIGVYQISRR